MLPSQTFPAQSPQNVVSKTICWFVKADEMSQPPEKCATGVPQDAGFGESPVASCGTEPRGKKYIEIPVLVQSIAYTPPPLALKLEP